MLFAEVPPPPPAIVQPAYDTRIRLNTVGFLPSTRKEATIGAPCKKFTLLRVSDGAVVFTGTAAQPIKTDKEDTDEQVQIVDFSEFRTPGQYRLQVEGVGSSAPFTIAADVWNTPYEAAARAMYLWRCGTAVETTWNGTKFSHAPCHLDDAWMDYAEGEHKKVPSLGGWHDAGDYNKYVVNAGVTIGMMLKAWEQFPKQVATDNLGIPESGNGVPDLLDEIRWELDWLFTMQADDGRVYHKVSARDFKFWGPSENDKSVRYFTPWSTVATADFTAIMAACARAWRPFDAAFADRCLAAARKSWGILARTPQQVDADQSAFSTGAYAPKDASHRLWALAELWETTNEAAFLQEFEKSTRAFGAAFTFDGPNWGDVQNLAFATYLSSAHPDARDAKLVKLLTDSLVKQARAAVEMSEKNGYGRPLGGARKTWYWGANGTVAGQTLVLNLADRLRPDRRYRETAQRALDFLFGRNFHARSYVTGIGANPPLHPHDRRGEPAWPGYLVGGGWPNGRSWADLLARYDLNEIAINWNGALLYATAAFVEPTSPSK
ncbi:MAG: glycoside hydrolase family 9 protein [Nibricoccus sp.]